MADGILLLLIAGYSGALLVRYRRQAKLAARMGRIMGCAGCGSHACGSCHGSFTENRQD